jgi:hypothetical protein
LTCNWLQSYIYFSTSLYWHSSSQHTILTSESVIYLSIYHCLDLVSTICTFSLFDCKMNSSHFILLNVSIAIDIFNLTFLCNNPFWGPVDLKFFSYLLNAWRMLLCQTIFHILQGYIRSVFFSNFHILFWLN